MSENVRQPTLFSADLRSVYLRQAYACLFLCKKRERCRNYEGFSICLNRFYVNCKSNFRFFCQDSSSVAEKCAMLQPFVNNAISGTLLQNTKHSVNVSILSAKTCRYNHCLSD